MGNKPSTSKGKRRNPKAKRGENKNNSNTQKTAPIASSIVSNSKSPTSEAKQNPMANAVVPNLVIPDVDMTDAQRNGPKPIVLDHFSNVGDYYMIEPKELGHGHYGVVRKCRDRGTSEWLAVKSIKKSKVNRLDILKREVNLLREVKHPNIIELKGLHEDEKYLHLVTELCTGGELFDRIIEKTQTEDDGIVCFSEKDASKLVRDVLSAVSYCHDEKGIVHRDLKPENFLFKDHSDNATIKIIDFGLSRHDDDNFGVMKTKVGTPYYVAPEVLERRYTKACDMWSIGVITYILLCGYPPFYGDSDSEIFRSVRAAEYDYPSPEWDSISMVARNFIDGLLKKNPEERFTAKQALNHQWLCGDSRANRVTHANRRSITYKKKEGMKKLRKKALMFLANRLTQSELAEIGGTFKTIDCNGDGLISLNEIDRALSKGALPNEIVEHIRSLRTKLLLEDSTASIDWKSFLEAAVEKNVSLREEKIKEVFSAFDRSKANRLSMADLIEVFGTEKQAREIMGDVDKDMDGVISYEEFKQALVNGAMFDMEL